MFKLHWGRRQLKPATNKLNHAGVLLYIKWGKLTHRVAAAKGLAAAKEECQFTGASPGLRFSK